MQGHRRRRETKRSPAIPIRPKGWGGTGPSFCCSSSPMSLHRLVVAPRSGLRRAPNKHYRIYGSEYRKTGVELHIKEIPFSRILPTAYYDQAIASIPAVYPGSEIVAKRRLGRFGPDLTASYSMVCYKESSEIDQVTISGVVIIDMKAWSFNALVESSLFADTLILVLETLAALPSKE